ncbi:MULTISPECIES: hypothetical protein [Paraburkholderia]|uniref:hypothetical protein n=1 Tax=Paraburkholderia TaxID=1822464 RepID=UPI0038BDEA7E
MAVKISRSGAPWQNRSHQNKFGVAVKRVVVWDVGLGCGFVVAVLLLGQIAWVEIGGKSAPDLWTVLSALGTVSATFVALFVAIHTLREKTREEKIRAGLAAAQLAPLLLHCSARLNTICNRLDEFIKIDPSPERYYALTSLFKDVVSYEPTFENLRDLAPLPNDCAESIAAGFAQLKLCSKMFLQAEYLYAESPEATDTRRQRSSIIAGLSKGVLDVLRPAIQICNDAAKVKIGGPGVK